MSIVTRLYRGETHVNFIGTRKRWYAASGVLIVICILSFVLRGFNIGVEFKGGTQFRIQVANTSVTSSQVNKAFTEAGTTPADVPQTVGEGSTRQVVVTTADLSAARTVTLQNAVAKTLNIAPGKINPEGISASFGRDIETKALEGLIIFLVVVSIFIAVFFRWQMTVGAIAALLHDILIAAGVYSLVGFEVTPSTVVGLLTILGFSLYDTVVVYDKVRENTRDLLAGSRKTYADAANDAVNQTLMRSINTSLIALLPVAGLLFIGAGILGVGTIKDLALILFVGLASGAYSSLFLATPIVVDLTERDPKYKALAKRVTAKRSSDARKAQEAQLAGVAGPAARSGGPAPAPKVGARPERARRRR
ncbi:protein translocase subunit SecF [uncultured Jatrophihabitans sp.]|uniref:protein translocase subunit SecF n=1 Tax=uncultured Jatrophihabitans sp. TaxID=1610747 RepID=UPI0035CC4AA8